MNTEARYEGRIEGVVGDLGYANVVFQVVWSEGYSNDASIVSQRPGSPEEMMGNIVKVSTTFGVAVPEAKTETQCLNEKCTSD